MQTDKSLPKPISYYGKKVYYFNPLIARKEPASKEPEYWYEDIEDSEIS